MRFLGFFLGALTLSAGCGGAAPAAPAPVAQLRVTVLPTPTFAGSPGTAMFTLQAENIGATPVTLTFPSSCQLLPYFTDGRTGQPVEPRGGGFACATVIVFRPLRAGESFSQVFTVKAGDAPVSQDVVLPPGDYRVYARLEDSRYRLQSDPLAFSLR